MVTLALSSKAAVSRAPFLTNSLNRYSMQSLTRRSYSNESVPSQIPLVGSSAWNAVLKNIEHYYQQPPLSQSEIKENQHFYTIEKRIDQTKWDAERASSLVFGEKKYTDLSAQEQNVVDFHQKKLKEDSVILPNTRTPPE